MNAMLNFATLAIAAMFAVAVASGLSWLFLQAVFVLMRPATARRASARQDLGRGTAQLARAFASNR
jgi:hypothetical protein